jgi:hypothetical protein
LGPPKLPKKPARREEPAYRQPPPSYNPIEDIPIKKLKEEQQFEI